MQLYFERPEVIKLLFELFLFSIDADEIEG
jgi:hypothetical protein